MKAVRFDHHGGVDVLKVVDVPQPEPGPGEILVAVKAAGINPGEAKIREGLFPATFPSGQGSDLAGMVERAGPGVTGFAAGAGVIGFTTNRASHAEYVVVDAGNLTRKPAGLPWVVAGALYVAGATAWAAVRAVAPVPGEVVVVAGAAGGVGSIAVQLARRAGARVVGLAGPENHEWLRAHGVIPVSHGDRDQMTRQIREVAPSVDAFIDTYGADYVELALEFGVRPARIDTIANFAAIQRYGVKGDGRAAGSSASVLAELAGLIAAGELEVPIAATFPLARIRDAYGMLAKDHIRGKIVLLPGNLPSTRSSVTYGLEQEPNVSPRCRRLAVNRGWHDELVEARANAILANLGTAEAYAEHFEAQMKPGKVGKLLSSLRRFRGRSVLLLVVILAPCAAFGYAAFTARMPTVPVSGANELAAVNTISGQVVGVTPLPDPPGAVSAADGSVWVADPDAGQVSRVAPGTGAEAAQIAVGGEPVAIASGGGAIWVADTGDADGASVVRIDPATDSVTQTIKLPWADPGAIAFGGGRVWVADPATRQLAEINPVTGSLERTLSLDLQPSAIAPAGQAIWVAGYDTATVEKLAPGSGHVLARVRVGGGPTALAVGAGSLWVACSLDATVSRIDLATSTVTAVVSVGPGPAALVTGPGPTALAAGPGSVWVADQDSRTVFRISPRTNRVTATVATAGAPTSLANTGSRVWTGIRQAAATTRASVMLR